MTWSMRVLAGAFMTVFLFAEGTAEANYYQRGYQVCEDFATGKQNYENEPESVDYEIAYAICLVLRGGPDEERGLNMLHRLADHENQVYAAFFLAEYIDSGGDFLLPKDTNKLNEAIEAYFKVLALINSDPRYPHNGHSIDEFDLQMELKSYYNVPLLFLHKYAFGLIGSERVKVLAAPSYEGDRDLNTFAQYNRHTMNSLDKMLEHANRCVGLPPKDHFIGYRYHAYTKACRIFRDAVQALRPLEAQRLHLMADDSCVGDVPPCQEYLDLRKEIMSIYVSMYEEIEEIFEPDNIFTNF